MHHISCICCNAHTTHIRCYNMQDEVSAELLLSRVLCAFQCADIKLHGRVTGLSRNNSDGNTAVVATIQPAKIECFGDFVLHSDTSVFTSDKDAFAWYSRMKLRFSCSSCCSLFVDCVIPELLQNGIRFMRYKDGTRIDLKTISCHSVWLNYQISSIVYGI